MLGTIVNLGDGGGLTRFGITSLKNPTAMHDGFYDMKTADALNYAKAYYKHCYWFPIRGDEISSDEIAASLFSFAVNDGPGEAAKLLQRAADVNVDGIIGAGTLAAVNRANSALLAEALRQEQTEFYKNVVAAKPQDMRFLDGWLKRAGRKYPELN